MQVSPDTVREQDRPTGRGERMSLVGVSRFVKGLRTKKCIRWDIQPSASLGQHLSMFSSRSELMLNHFLESLILAQGERWRRA